MDVVRMSSFSFLNKTESLISVVHNQNCTNFNEPTTFAMTVGLKCVVLLQVITNNFFWKKPPIAALQIYREIKPFRATGLFLYLLKI